MSALTTGATAAAIQAHYDTGDRFFAAFLDPSMTYSCALYETGEEDLAAAQTAKIDWHLRRAVRQPQQNLLDIGCGWGGLLMRARDRFAIRRGVGLTLSQAQAAHGRALGDGLAVRLEAWSDHEAPHGGYDAIVSIGAFEHFAAPGLDRAARIAAYRAFFQRVAQWLPPGGRLTLQTMAYPEDFDRAGYDASPFGAFVRAEIFPQSDLPMLTEILAGANGSFDIEELRDDRRCYAATLRAWRANLRAGRAEAEAAAGPRRTADFDGYFRTSASLFELGNLRLLRMVFARRSRRP